MRQFSAGRCGKPRGSSRRETAKATTLILALVFFSLGIAVGAFWYYRAAQPGNTAGQDSAPGLLLSESTRAALRVLKSPVEIRFYSILGSESGGAALRAFSDRVDQLLSEYEREAGGKIKLARHTTESDAELAAAAADGIRALNLDKGEGSLLGITVAQQDRKESLAQLNPEWEPALEADLTRVILRVTGAPATAPRTAAMIQADAEATEAVTRSIPNFASVSVLEGRQILREASLNELKVALTEFEAQLKAAQQRLSDAQASRSEAEQQAALQEIHQLETRQTQKLKDISARFQAQTAALERLKSQ